MPHYPMSCSRVFVSLLWPHYCLFDTGRLSDSPPSSELGIEFCDSRVFAMSEIRLSINVSMQFPAATGDEEAEVVKIVPGVNFLGV